MLISVGGTENPVINSVVSHQPAKIIFFVSKSSRSQVNDKIMPGVFQELGEMIDHEFVVTRDEQNIGDCVSVLLSEIPKAMKKLGLDFYWPDIVDYTGGTKTMSAAVVWASSKFECEFNYVGGTERTKAGLGIVMDGKEANITLQNPWNSIAYFELNDALKLFNTGQYSNAAELFKAIRAKITEEKHQRVFTLLGEIFEGYAMWDMFNHKDASRLIGKNVKTLIDIAENEKFYLPNLVSFAEEVKTNFEFLQKISPNRLSPEIIDDLLANALRRAELEKKYEDATARTYAAIEKIARLQLFDLYAIDNSKCPPNKIPGKLRSLFETKYVNPRGLLQFGAVASYELLVELDNPYGRRFESLAHIREHLTERNRSILGHGMQSINKEKFSALFKDAIFILDRKIEDLPCFPKIKIL